MKNFLDFYPFLKANFKARGSPFVSENTVLEFLNLLVTRDTLKYFSTFGKSNWGATWPPNQASYQASNG